MSFRDGGAVSCPVVRLEPDRVIDCNDVSRSKRNFPSQEGMEEKDTTIDTTQ